MPNNERYIPLSVVFVSIHGRPVIFADFDVARESDDDKADQVFHVQALSLN